MIENLQISFQGIWNHKMRSFLTMLGIIIGIASIISIVSTLKGTNEKIKDQLIGEGNNVVTVSLQTDNYDVDFSSPVHGVKVGDEEAREAISKKPGIKDASFYHNRSYSSNIYYRNSAFSGNVFGVDSHYMEVNGYSTIRGRGFVASDYKDRHNVVILENSVAYSLFAGVNPLGRVLEISRQPFTVVGVVDKLNSSTQTLNASGGEKIGFESQSAGSIFIPIDCWPVAYQYDEPVNLAVRAIDTDSMTKAGKSAEDYMNDNLVTDQKYKYVANDLLKSARELQAASNAQNMQLIWIAGISLLVGGIGVMNIMLVSVTERTKEIGLKKALGAKKWRILTQFLTESAALTSIGGLLGVVAGIGLSKVISRVSETATAVSIPACLLGVGFSMLLGVFFGFLPARRAAMLNPIDALRSE